MPSLKKRLSARVSLKRYVRHNMGLKMPRGAGFITNPKKALYNKIYNKTSVGIDRLARGGVAAGKETKNNLALPPILLSIIIAVLLLAIYWPLGWEQPKSYNYNFWKKYCDQMQSLSDRVGLPIRTIDKALWQYSKENQPRK